MKVCFIICTNSDLWFSECRTYIENLIIPENVEIEIIGIENASSMAGGYAVGCSRTNADYKVYLHQDTFIINRHFIEDIDRIFRSDDKIGVIGMIGSNDVAKQKISWCDWECGKVIVCNGYQELKIDYGEIAETYRVVDCLDGMILITRYNVPWREDVFKGWHFYDRSICMEYRRKGFVCVVPRQETAWCIHDCGPSTLIGWSDAVTVFLGEYKDFFQEEHVLECIEMVDEHERLQLEKIAANIELLVNNKKMNEASSFLQGINETGVMKNKKIAFLNILLEIWQMGQWGIFFAAGDSVDDMEQKYIKGSFLLRREVYGLMQDERGKLLLSQFTEGERKIILRHKLTLHNSEQDNRKIAFIIHVTHEAYEKECLGYLARLEIPDGYTVEFLTVSDAADMATAYEEARQASNAKFKIYLEDRTFVINHLLIQDLLTIFEKDTSIGAVGIWGVQSDLDGGIGKVILSDPCGTRLLSSEKVVDVSGELYDVVAFLGEGLFATQIDLAWETQKDVKAQSLYYQENGCKAVVARQRSVWCLLDQKQEKDVLSCLEEIAKREGERGLSSPLLVQDDVYTWYLRAKFQLRRIEYHFPQEDSRELLDALQCGRISIEAIDVIRRRELLYNQRVMNYLKNSLMKPQVCEADGNLSMAGSKVLHVASSLNRKYVRYACVMLESLCRWNPDVDIHAWLLHGELEESDLALIQKTLAGRRITVDLLYVDKNNFAKCRITDMWSVEAYFRLQMMDLLPASVDRLLYLDVDTLVLRSVYDLYFTDFEGMDIIGCRDLGSTIPFGDMRDEIFADYMGRSDFAYCNSGVMLWNAAKLRGKISFQDYLKVMEEREYRLLAVDQDVINLVHAGRIKLVDAERYDFFARPMFSRVGCEEMKSHVSILHYSGPKPWDGRQKREEVDALWWEVARDMPFYTSLLEDMLQGSFQREAFAG